MKILVTGGFGFLGGRLAQLLAQADNEVVLGTRGARKAPDGLAAAVVARMDWQSNDTLVAACRGTDAVVHLAGLNAQASSDHPAAALEVNGDGTARMVEAAITAGVSRFVHLSTAHVYGAPLTGTITEATPSAGPHPYATSHLAGEDAVRRATDNGRISGIVLRLSNAFGPPAHRDADCWMLLINDLCRQASQAGAMALRTAGLERRDFIPMSEACRAIDHMVHLPPPPRSLTCNLGGGWAPTVWEAALLVQERCAAVTGRRPSLTRPDARTDEVTLPLDYRTDALLETGFQPRDERSAEVDRLINACLAWFAPEGEAA